MKPRISMVALAVKDLAVARAGAAAIEGADMFLDFVPMGAEDTGIIRGSDPDAVRD